MLERLCFALELFTKKNTIIIHPTIGVNCFITHTPKKDTLNIYDFSGKKKYEFLTLRYIKIYPNSTIIFMYRTDIIETLLEIKNLHQLYLENNWSGLGIVIAKKNGNNDLVIKKGLEFAKEKNYKHLILDINLDEDIQKVKSVVYESLYTNNEEKNKKKICCYIL